MKLLHNRKFEFARKASPFSHEQVKNCFSVYMLSNLRFLITCHTSQAFFHLIERQTQHSTKQNKLIIRIKYVVVCPTCGFDNKKKKQQKTKLNKREGSFQCRKQCASKSKHGIAVFRSSKIKSNR